MEGDTGMNLKLKEGVFTLLLIFYIIYICGCGI
jgi:hypothetical protein